MTAGRQTGSGRSSTNYMKMLAAIAVLVSCGDPSSQDLRDVALQPEVRSIASPDKILFIGNSFTYYNGGIDGHLREMLLAADSGSTVFIDSLTTPNQTVEGHFRSPLTHSTLDGKSWDLVVVQGASYEPVESDTLENFSKNLVLMADNIRSGDAEVALFMTWAYRSRQSMIDELAAGYLKSGNEIAALVVPVGLAWERIRQQRSVRFLYSDPRHPSLQGTYLAACVFYAALFDKSPVGNAYRAGIAEEDARYLQQVAWETTRQFFDIDPAP